MTALHTKQVGLPKKPCESPLDYRINFLTKKVSDIRLRIYVCPLIDSMRLLAEVMQHRRHGPRLPRCCSPERAVRARVLCRYDGLGNYLRELGSTSAFLPAISEMRHPKGYRKAAFTCMALVNAAI